MTICKAVVKGLEVENFNKIIRNNWTPFNCIIRNCLEFSLLVYLSLISVYNQIIYNIYCTHWRQKLYQGILNKIIRDLS